MSDQAARAGDVTAGVAVVTGGASGIGLALARSIVDRGGHVVVGDIEQDRLDDLVGEHGITPVQCDVRRRESFETLRQVALAAHGRIDLVCLNAGVAPTGPVLETSEATWRWLFEVNVLGVAHGLSVLGAELAASGGGHVLITASLAGLVASPGLGAYSASKHAVIGLAATAREELASAGVGLTVLCPGFVATNVFDSERNRPADLAGDSHPDPAVMEFVTAMVEVAGLSADEVASAALQGVRAESPFVLPNHDLDDVVRARDDGLRRSMQR